MPDNLEALYAQWLAGGSPRVINPVQVQGPNISPMAFSDMGGDGGASGFASLADGILGYMDKRKKEKEKAAGAGTGVSDASPPANTFGGGGSQYQGHPQPVHPDDVFGGGGAQYRPPPTSAGAPYPEVTTSPLPSDYAFGGGGGQYQGPSLMSRMTSEQIAMLTPEQLAWLTLNSPPR